MHWLWLLTGHCLATGTFRGTGDGAGRAGVSPLVLVYRLTEGWGFLVLYSAAPIWVITLAGGTSRAVQPSWCVPFHIHGAESRYPLLRWSGCSQYPLPHPRSVRFSQPLMEIFVPSL